MITLSICIAAYNAEEYVAEAIHSILPVLKKFNSELIFVNDGSTDKTETVVLEELRHIEPNRYTFVSGLNLGSAAARNCALHMAKGEWIYFLDADDVIVPENLSLLFSYLPHRAEDLIQTQWKDLQDVRAIEHAKSDQTLLKMNQIDLRSVNSKQTFVHEVGYWRNIYRRKFLVDLGIEFYPTFNESGGRYTFDDYYFLVSVANNLEQLCQVDILTYLYRSRKEGLSENYLGQLDLEGQVLSKFVLEKHNWRTLNKFLAEELYRRFLMSSEILFKRKRKKATRFSTKALMIIIVKSKKNRLRRAVVCLRYLARLLRQISEMEKILHR